MTQQNPPPFNPFGAWTSMRDSYMDAWAKGMIDLVSSEEYARATGAFLDTYLSVSEPFRRTVEKAMEQVLTGLNMPTRQDVVSLAERLTNIEMRLDDLDAKIDGLAAAGATGSAPRSHGEE
jgi:hypothetical protein